MTKADNSINGWWRLVVGLLIGALAPSLIAWGSIGAKVEHNVKELNKKVNVATFNEYKEGNTKLLEAIQDSLNRIEKKINGK